MDHYLITVNWVLGSGLTCVLKTSFYTTATSVRDLNGSGRGKDSRILEFGSLKLWWEVGKTQILGFCQQCTSSSTAKLKTAMENLKAIIKGMAFGVSGHRP